MNNLPDVDVNVLDNALGLVGQNTDQLFIKLGVCSLGVPNQIYSISNMNQVAALLGTGPLAESVATHLALSGQTVLAVPVNPSQAGKTGTVTHSGTGTGTVTPTGTPLDAYNVVVTMTRANAFTLSLDGGNSVSAELAVPASNSYAIANTGLTLNFAGPLVAGDTYAFVASAPGYTLADLNTAVTGVMADPRDWSIMHIKGVATAATAAAAAAWAAQARNAFRFVRIVLEARDIDQNTDNGNEATWESNLLNEWRGFADTRVGVTAGYLAQTSSLTGRLNRVSLGDSYVARLASIAVSEHPGYVGRGPLPGVAALYHNEQVNPGLDAAGFVTARTIIGRRGYYVTNGRVMAPAGSDYQYIELARVMDKCCTISRNAALQFLNQSVKVNAAGNLSDTDAAAIEGYVEGQLRAEVVNTGDISDVTVTVAGINILSTRAAQLAIRIEPLSYLSHIEEEIGFINPALATLTAAAGG